jgi:hypothetical protein
MFQLFCYFIYVHVKIINVNWNMELNLRMMTMGTRNPNTRRVLPDMKAGMG